MKIALVSDTFAPLHTSGAAQMEDLAEALARQGHDVVVMVAGYGLDANWKLEQRGAFRVLRLKCPQTKGLSNSRRLLAEWWMPYAMRRNWLRSPLRDITFDGVAFYSPSIFHTPLVEAIRRAHGARTYLILRDIFPDWALDMGLLKKGPVYSLLKGIAKRQYRAADVIGVQSPGNVELLDANASQPHSSIEVLHNWLEPRPDAGCPIDLSNSPLSGRKLCVYAGNIGVAQKLDVVVEVADLLSSRSDIGFVLVGRGNDAPRIAREIAVRRLDNILMFDEIELAAIPGLFRQCSVGLVILDERHRTHNIPGKFVAYVHAGLPVLAVINPNNDLIDLIDSTGVGVALADRKASVISDRLIDLLERIDRGEPIALRCQELASDQFSADRAAAQIVQGLKR